MRIVRFLIVSLAVMLSTSCYYLGCYSVHDACYECCKKALVPYKRTLGGQKAWAAREPCTNECVDFANSRDKDGFWVEKNEACMLDTVDYFSGK